MRQDGKVVGDVVLPPWAKNADEFVATMKDFKQSASRIVFGGPKARRSGGVSDALNWTPGPITAFELNLSDREVKRWLRSPLAASTFAP